MVYLECQLDWIKECLRRFVRHTSGCDCEGVPKTIRSRGYSRNLRFNPLMAKMFVQTLGRWQTVKRDLAGGRM